MTKLLKRLAAAILIGYIFLCVAFYFLAGEQLHLRDSRANLPLPIADSGTVELAAGNTVEQYFTTDIQRLEKIDVQWGTYYRPNAGQMLIELYDLQNNSLLLSQSFNAADIAEGAVTTLAAEQPIEGLVGTPLLLKISSPDAAFGSAPSPMMNTQEVLANGSLVINGTPVAGTLCFALSGTDYIWTGLHYWQFAAAGFVLLAALLLWTAWRYKAGKRSLLINAIYALQKYRFLIRQLVSRDFKTKYKRSILGMFWSFLNPLLTMLVMYIVFSNLFRFDVPHYPVYLITGVVIFNFFSESTNMALGSIIGNAGLITKVYMPKYIYPLTRVLSSLVNLVISLAPLLLVAICSGIIPTKAYILVPYALVCLAVFCLGVGMFLAAAMVFFRDVQFLWGVLTMIWMYLTPIFYPASILPENIAWVLDVNPLNHYISFARMCIIDGISPEPIVYFQCALISLVTLLLGAFVFRKSQDRFVLYL